MKVVGVSFAGRRLLGVGTRVGHVQGPHRGWGDDVARRNPYQVTKTFFSYILTLRVIRQISARAITCRLRIRIKTKKATKTTGRTGNLSPKRKLPSCRLGKLRINVSDSRTIKVLGLRRIAGTTIMTNNDRSGHATIHNCNQLAPCTSKTITSISNRITAKVTTKRVIASERQPHRTTINSTIALLCRTTTKTSRLLNTLSRRFNSQLLNSVNKSSLTAIFSTIRMNSLHRRILATFRALLLSLKMNSMFTIIMLYINLVVGLFNMMSNFSSLRPRRKLQTLGRRLITGIRRVNKNGKQVRITRLHSNRVIKCNGKTRNITKLSDVNLFSCNLENRSLLRNVTICRNTNKVGTILRLGLLRGLHTLINIHLIMMTILSNVRRTNRNVTEKRNACGLIIRVWPNNFNGNVTNNARSNITRIKIIRSTLTTLSNSNRVNCHVRLRNIILIRGTTFNRNNNIIVSSFIISMTRPLIIMNRKRTGFNIRPDPRNSCRRGHTSNKTCRPPGRPRLGTMIICYAAT